MTRTGFPDAKAIMKHDGVAECAVIGVPDPIKGEVPLALFVLNDGEMLTMEEDVDADSDACERATLVSKRGEEESM
ncbi:hypothetical protein HPB49_019352 [Dermacentor silvarum]|uniref:Uncharacterized protein n=1 Tax=Dermacentor silvarum TaxID=543639 RepID=A0ACB8CZD5_DERSI|nr:hypothetical protein HPB49_019352 [Dermacentor silvarum]